MTAKDYTKLLREHDWYWYQSHDPKIISLGEKNEKNLKSLYVQYPTLKKYYFRYQKLNKP